MAHILFLFEVTNSANSGKGLSMRNRLARRANKRADLDTTPLIGFFGVNGQFVPGFPRTLGEAKRLNGKCLNL